MAQVGTTGDSIKDHVQDFARDASPWITALARFGYVAKGVVYLVIAVLAFMTALGLRRQPEGVKGAIAEIGAGPFGQPLLIVLAVGLMGYALFQLTLAVLDPDHFGSDLKGLTIRIGSLVSAIGYGLLAYVACQVALGLHVSGDAQSSRESTAALLARPFGQVLLGVTGVITLISGFVQIANGIRAGFRKYLRIPNERFRFWALMMGRIGYVAVGIIMAIVGALLIEAALHLNPNKSKGMVGAFQKVLGQPEGPWLLGLMSLGLILYALFMFVKARYRAIRVG